MRILLIKKCAVKEADYANADGEVVGAAYIRLIGLYVFDLRKGVMIDCQTFKGSSPPESIKVNYLGYNQYGSSPDEELDKYLRGEESEVAYSMNLESVLKVAYNFGIQIFK
jgi:hypothetical protein